MRNLKKILSVLLVVAIMAISMVPAFAAETYTYSTQANALHTIGLFNGVSTSEFNPDLGSSLTREQGIALVVRLIGKADAAAALTAADADAAIAAFGDAKDVEPTLENAVAYAVKNNLVIGTDAKLLNPKGAMSGNDLATIILRNIGYTVDATGYNVATATLSDKGGLTTAEATKFATKDLIRDDAVGIMYGSLQAKYADNTVVIANLIKSGAVKEADAVAAGVWTKTALTATSTVTGAYKFTVAFNNTIDATKAAVTVNKGSIAYNVATVAAGTDNKSLVVTMASKLSAGDYTLSISGLTDTALTTTVTAADEKVNSIVFNSTQAPISRDGLSVSVGYKVLNQYNEDVTSTYNVTVSASRGVPTIPTNGTVVVTDTTAFLVTDKVAVQLLYAANGTFASTVVTPSFKAQVADVAINGLVLNSSNEALDTTNVASDYKLDVTLKDQYGNNVTDTTYLNNGTDVTVTVSAPQYVTVAGGTSTAGVVSHPAFAYDSTAKKMYLPLYSTLAGGLPAAGTSTVTIISNTTGKIATFDVVVKSSGKVDTLSLSAPDLAPAGEKVNIPFSAVDVYGNAMTSATALNSGVTSISSSAGSVSFVQDVVAGKANLVLDLTSVQTAQTVVITGITSTSKLVQLSVNVVDPRKPVLISSTTSDFTPNLAVGATSSLKNSYVVVKDQYNRNITTVRNFATSTDDSIYTQYRIEATTSAPAYVELSGAKDTTVTTDTYYINSTANDATNPVVLNSVAKGASTITLKLQKLSDMSLISGSDYVFTSTVVDKTDIVSYELATVPTLFATANTAYEKAITVNGVLANGTKVVVPSTYYTVTAPDLNTTVLGYVYADGAYASLTPTNTSITVPLTVTVNGATTTSVLAQSVTISNVQPAPKTIALITAADTVNDITPVGTTAVTVSSASTANIAAVRTLALNAIKTVDQYGVELTASTTPVAESFADVIVTNLPSTRGLGALQSGDSFNVTAVTTNGLTLTFKVIVK